MLPSMCISSFVIGPLIVIGALPPLEEQLAPHDINASRRGPIGLFLMDSSPVMVTSESNNAEIPVISLMVVPELRTSIVLSGACIFFVSTSSPSSVSSTAAPIDLTASAVALVSNDIRGLVILHLPPERADMMIAL